MITKSGNRKDAGAEVEVFRAVVEVEVEGGRAHLARCNRHRLSSFFSLSLPPLPALSNVESVPKVARHDHPAGEQRHGAEEALLLMVELRRRKEKGR